MNVSAIQSGLGMLLKTATTLPTGGGAASASSTSGAAAIFQRSGSSSNAFFANNYSHLGTRTGGSSSTPAGLQTAGFALGRVAVTQALQAASKQQGQARNEVIKSAVDQIDAGNYAKARKIAEGMLDKDGRDAAAAHIIARSHLGEKDYDKAEKYFARASTLAPNSRRFASDLANVRLLKKPDREVKEEAARLVRQPERRAEGIRLLGYLADRSPDDAEAHMLLGDALMAHGIAVGAVSSYRNALVVADESELEPLVERFRDLTAKAPDVGVTHSLLGQALQKQGHYAEAMSELKRAAEIAPTNMSYHYAVAGVYADMGHEALEQGRISEAIRHYEEATGMDPSSGDYKAGLARAHLNMSKWWLARGLDGKAFTELNASKQQAPSDYEQLNTDIARMFSLMGDRYRHADDLDWAISSYKRAYDLDSTNLGYKTDLASAYDAKGTEYFDAGDYVKAEENYQEAVDLFPGRESYQTRLQAAKDAQ